jgi:hypothetical protein
MGDGPVTFGIPPERLKWSGQIGWRCTLQVVVD